jgi:hypothetical protein
MAKYRLQKEDPVILVLPEGVERGLVKECTVEKQKRTYTVLTESGKEYTGVTMDSTVNKFFDINFNLTKKIFNSHYAK